MNATEIDEKIDALVKRVDEAEGIYQDQIRREAVELVKIIEVRQEGSDLTPKEKAHLKYRIGTELFGLSLEDIVVDGDG